MNGVPPQAVRNIYGVAKSYETYVGTKAFQPPGEVFNKIQKEGQEYASDNRSSTTSKLDEFKFSRKSH